jgi:hypothetical protein
MPSNEDITNFDALFSQLQKMITCDGACLEKKEADNLKQIMQNAATNIETAPDELQVAQKNYVTFTAGEQGYNELREQQLKDEADKIIQQYNNKYDEILKNIQTQIDTYEGIFINFKNVIDLYLIYKKENANLEKSLKNTTSDVLTSERKTFYQDQQVDVLKFYYYYIILIIYCICVFCYVMFSLIYPSKTDWKIRLATFIGLILLPLVSTWILGLFIYIIYMIYDLIPTNVYKQEFDAKTNYNYYKNL